MTAPALEGVFDTSCIDGTDMMAVGKIAATAGTQPAGERYDDVAGAEGPRRTRLATWGGVSSGGRSRLTRDPPARRMGSLWAGRRMRNAGSRAFLRVRRRRALIRLGFELRNSSDDRDAKGASVEPIREDRWCVTREGDVALPSPDARCTSEDSTSGWGVKGVAVSHEEGDTRTPEQQGDLGGTDGHVELAVVQEEGCNPPALQLSPPPADVGTKEPGKMMNIEPDTLMNNSGNTGEPAGACTPPDGGAFSGWARKRHKRMGHCDAHARFLQHLFRGYRRIRPSGWRPGGLAGCPMPRRPVTTFRCRGGRCGAADSDFDEQRARAEEVLGWYSMYPDLLGRLENQRPRTYHPYCAAGADAAGVQRMRGVPFGSDVEDQPSYRLKFGEDTFAVRDATASASFHQAVDAIDPTLIMQSPPCKAYSTADFQDRSEAPELIARSRDLGLETGRLFVIENVKGAAAEFQDHAVLLYGAYFGLHVDKPRFFEANFPLHVDQYLKVPGLRLRTLACLGKRRRWRRLDPFGRPELTECCDGNLFPIQGTAPSGFTLEEAAHAMGVDAHHMPFERLAQAIPPAYAQLVFALACMERCRAVYGVPVITFDEMLTDRTTSRRRMAFFLRGAGAPGPEAGLCFSPAHATPWGSNSSGPPGGVDVPFVPAQPQGPSQREASSLVREVEFREVFYCRGGNFDQVCSLEDQPEIEWLSLLRPALSASGERRAFDGLSSLVVTRHEDLPFWIGKAKAALEQTPGTRLVLQIPAGGAAPGTSRRLREAGFREVRRSSRGEARLAMGESPAVLPSPWVWWAAGEERCAPSRRPLDLQAAEAGLDPRDRGEIQDDADAKAARPFLPVEHDPAKWFDTGLPL